MNTTEETYTIEIQTLLEDYKKEIKRNADIHRKLSKSFYIKHVVYGIPQILIPVTMVFISQLELTDDQHQITSGLGFLITGILNGVYNFFSFNIKQEKHDSASNRYSQLNKYIESNMSRGISYRIPADVMVSYVKNEFKNLEIFSPSIDNACIFNLTK